MFLGYTLLAFYAYCKCVELLEKEETRLNLRIVRIPVEKEVEQDDRLS